MVIKMDWDEYCNIQIEARKIAINKNEFYGTSTLVKFGKLGMIIRLSDKINRLQNLIMKNNNKKIKESIMDNCLDLINYSTYLLMIERGKLIKNDN